MSASQNAYPVVSIVVLSYNSLEHLRDCLDSLIRLDYRADRLELLLVDNASSDGSPDWVAAHYPVVRIVHNGSNLGFAAGNTAGAQAARGEWVAFLNPDTRVEPGWLLELIQPALRNPDVICVASKMLSWDGRAIDFADAAINFMGWGCQPGYGSRRLGDFEQDKEALFACGGAMLIKRQVFLEVGGFDPDYYAYYEDVDLGWRLWLMGYKVALAARAVVYHRHHGSWSHVSYPKRWVLAERNTLFTVIKNYDDANLARVLPAALLLALQRAYLDVRPAPASFGHVAAPAASPLFGPRYYFDQARQLLQGRAYRQLLRRTVDEAGRRWQRFRSPAPRAAHTRARPVDGRFEVPAVALSRLVAGRDVLREFPSLMRKRQTIQSARKRSDLQVFPLFRWALLSNFDDDQFIHSMQQVIARFGLASVFDCKSEPAPVNGNVRDLSLEVSLSLLQVMERAFALSGVPEVHFRLDGPLPMEINSIPFGSVAVLAAMNRLLWSLPDAPLDDVLSWLAGRCRQILESTAPTHG